MSETDPAGGSISREADSAHAPGALDRLVGKSVFGNDADTYDRSRSDYPVALFQAVGARAVASPRIGEIGAGTGLATIGLLELKPSSLTLIEPDAGMADFLSRRFAPLGAKIIREPFVDALIRGPFDLIACAAAFHWLDPLRALSRIKALLEPGGVWAVWWNSYFGHGFPDPFAERVSSLLEQEAIILPPSYVERKHYAFNASYHTSTLREAGFEKAQQHLYAAERVFTPQDVRDLYSSFSFIHVLEVKRRERVLDLIYSVVENEFAGRAHSLCATALYTCQRPIA